LLPDFRRFRYGLSGLLYKEKFGFQLSEPFGSLTVIFSDES